MIVLRMVQVHRVWRLVAVVGKNSLPLSFPLSMTMFTSLTTGTYHFFHEFTRNSKRIGGGEINHYGGTYLSKPGVSFIYAHVPHRENMFLNLFLDFRLERVRPTSPYSMAWAGIRSWGVPPYLMKVLDVTDKEWWNMVGLPLILDTRTLPSTPWGLSTCVRGRDLPPLLSYLGVCPIEGVWSIPPEREF